MNLSLFASMGLAISSTIILSGCGTSAASFCDQVCACTGCSDSEKADCVDSFEDSQKVADEAGCDSEFDALVECSADELECNDSTVTVDGCDSEAEAVSSCADEPIAVGGNVCDVAIQRIVQKLTSCGVEVETGGQEGEQLECTGTLAAQAACIADCYSAASCDEINGEEGGGDFNDCFLSCPQ